MFANHKTAAHRLIGSAIAALLVCALIAPPVLAFHRHLTPEQVREAYFTGCGPASQDAVSAQYFHELQPARTGPVVQFIVFATPFEQVIQRADQESDHYCYFPVGAARHYAKGTNDRVVIYVRIESTLDFSSQGKNPKASHLYVRSFKFVVSQAGHQIPYRDLQVIGPIYRLLEGLPKPPVPVDFDVRLRFAASQFTADDPVTVEITAPTGQIYSTTFDVAGLR